MKKLVPAFLALTLLITGLSVSSCKKDKDEDNTSPTSDKITGKWKFSEAIGKYTIMGMTDSDTTTFTDDDYIDFKADGTVDVHESGDDYSGNWSLSNSKLIITNSGYFDDPQGYDVPVSTNTDLTIYRKITEGSTTIEQWLKLKK